MTTVTYIKVAYFDRIRAISFLIPYPKFELFKEKVWLAFPRLTDAHRRAAYFCWNDQEGDDIIMRDDNEFQMALHVFEQISKIPKFELCFEEHFTEAELEFTSVVPFESRLGNCALFPHSNFVDLTSVESKPKKAKK